MANSIEDIIQASCVKWFDQEYPAERQMLFAVPNGEKRGIITAMKLTSAGVRPGVSDLILVASDKRIYFLECKAPGSGRQSKEQSSFEAKLLVRGHIYLIFTSLQEFKEIIWQVIGK